LATSNNSFLVKNGLSVGGSSGIINVIDNQGNWIGATGTLNGATGPAGATGIRGASGISGASGYVGLDGATGSRGATGPKADSAWTVITGATSFEVSTKYLVDTTSGAFTVTLPASPGFGDTITIGDAWDFNSYNLTINPNGNTISDVSGNLVISTKGIIVNLVYYNTWMRYNFNFVAGVPEIYGDLMSESGSEDLMTGSGNLDLNI
jgi:hypothetical protein